VRLKILPAEPIFTARSRIPSRPSTERCRRPSKTTCSQTSSEIAMASWRRQKSARSARSSSGKIVAVGLRGLLNTTALVRGEKARARASSVSRKCGGWRVTNFGTPPARRTRGR
jgi:hypothetical protein